MPAFFLAMALRFPGTAKFLGKWGKLILIMAAAGALVFAFQHWKHGVQQASYNQGFTVAEKQYAAAVTKANAVIASDNVAMTSMAGAIGTLAKANNRDLQIKIDPMIKVIRDEIASNPMYRDCRVSDSVLQQTNIAGAAVNDKLTATNPR